MMIWERLDVFLGQNTGNVQRGEKWDEILLEYDSARPQMNGKDLEWVPVGGIAMELWLQGNKKGGNIVYGRPRPREHGDLDILNFNPDQIHQYQGVEKMKTGPVHILYRNHLTMFQVDGKMPDTCAIEHDGREFVVPELEYLVITKLCSSEGGCRPRDINDVKSAMKLYNLDDRKLSRYYLASPRSKDQPYDEFFSELMEMSRNEKHNMRTTRPAWSFNPYV